MKHPEDGSKRWKEGFVFFQISPKAAALDNNEATCGQHPTSSKKRKNPQNGRLNLLHCALSPAFLIPADCHQWAGMKEPSSTLFFEAQRACRCSTFAEWNTWRRNLKLRSWRYWWEAASSRSKDRSSSPDGGSDSRWTTAGHIVGLRRQKAAGWATISSPRAASTVAFRRNLTMWFFQRGPKQKQKAFECSPVSKQPRLHVLDKIRKSSQRLSQLMRRFEPNRDTRTDEAGRTKLKLLRFVSFFCSDKGSVCPTLACFSGASASPSRVTRPADVMVPPAVHWPFKDAAPGERVKVPSSWFIVTQALPPESSRRPDPMLLFVALCVDDSDPLPVHDVTFPFTMIA